MATLELGLLWKLYENLKMVAVHGYRDSKVKIELRL
jgi:hypothetical protein